MGCDAPRGSRLKLIWVRWDSDPHCDVDEQRKIPYEINGARKSPIAIPIATKASRFPLARGPLPTWFVTGGSRRRASSTVLPARLGLQAAESQLRKP